MRAESEESAAMPVTYPGIHLGFIRKIEENG